jgi:glycosyltransferase involved in cell wall biosynthesis
MIERAGSRMDHEVAPKVAIVSDPLVQRGGAERVVEAIAEAFPSAPIFTIVYSADRGPASLSARVRPSYLQRMPGAQSSHRVFLPLFVSAIESFDLSEFDLIVSSHHTVAKGLLRGADQVHVCYCHTPMRALWERSAAELSIFPPPLRLLAGAVLGRLRVWDVSSTSRVDQFVANSRVTQNRIAKHYGRPSIVLNPPIDTELFTPDPAAAPSDANGYYLIASRAVPYKRVDIAVEAARSVGRRVIVVGGVHKDLPDDPAVITLGVVDDARLIGLMRGARALLFPQYEDFGMTPLEMNACGRPVIAFGAGGATETVLDGKTGILVPDQTVEAFATGIRRAEELHFNAVELRKHAELFSRHIFIDQLRTIVYDAWNRRFERSEQLPNFVTRSRDG